MTASHALSQLSYSPMRVLIAKETCLCQYDIDRFQDFFIYFHFCIHAGVVKLVDALDSKSSFPCGSGGSIPPSGTTK